MKILFLLSCLEPAGSETYCLSLEKAWAGRHEVFWISDRLHFGQSYVSLPISKKAVPYGIANTRAVARWVRQHGIELIHSHSRRARWVAAQVAALSGIPHVSTIHQPPPVHVFSKLFPCLGDAVIAIDEAVVDHLKRHFRIPAEKIHLIRNGIEIPRLPPSPGLRPASPQGRGMTSMVFPLPAGGGIGATTPKGEGRPIVLWLGRLTGGRWNAYQFFLDILRGISKTLPPARYRIAGRVPDDQRQDIERQIRDLNSRIHPSWLELVPWTDRLSDLITQSTVVVAAGRSAMESLALERPVLVLGERGVLGLAREDNWACCLETNFGDHLPERSLIPARLEVALREALDPATDRAALGRWGREQAARYYDIASIASAVEDLFSRVVRA